MADETQEDIISIVAALELKIKQETRSIGIMYRNYDSNLLNYIDTLEVMVEKNRKGVAALLEQSKLNVQNLEFKRRMVASGVAMLKQPLMSLWADPDRGNFMPVDFI